MALKDTDSEGALEMIENVAGASYPLPPGSQFTQSRPDRQPAAWLYCRDAGCSGRRWHPPGPRGSIP